MRIIHAADRYVVVDKPAWMLSVPGKGPGKRDSVSVCIAGMYPGASGPLVVHRLDMETSGLMVLALDAAAQRDLSMQFERRTVEKAYVALVPGDGPPLDADDGVIELPLRADIENRPIQIVDLERGRPSRTRWRIASRETDRLRLRMHPETGRTHQLRVHSAAGLGRPIVGDRLYGGEPAQRLMLHATVLSFVEPGSMRRVEFESVPPF